MNYRTSKIFQFILIYNKWSTGWKLFRKTAMKECAVYKNQFGDNDWIAYIYV